jgi:hypothetical protein
MKMISKNVIIACMCLFISIATAAQTKKKTTAKKSKVTVQKPAQTPAKAVETTQSASPTGNVQGTAETPAPTIIPQAERESIVITQQQANTDVIPAKPTVNTAAERAYQSDSLSVHPIDPSNVLYRITNWRRLDLKEKMNQPFFSKNAEITKFLLEGVKSGVLTPYTNDTLNTPMSIETFNKNLIMEDTGGDGLSDEEKAAGFGNAGADDGWGAGADKPTSTKPTPGAASGIDDGWGNVTPAAGSKTTGTSTANLPSAANTTAASDGTLQYFARDLTTLEIKEDFIFDKQRSRAYNSIQAITLIIPAEKTVRGFNVPVASFRYKDLDKYFRSNPKCIWYNFKNISQHRNMADAFDLRLFTARIIKQSNPTDSYLVDTYKGDKEGLRASELMEQKLMEFEHNLWEY